MQASNYYSIACQSACPLKVFRGLCYRTCDTGKWNWNMMSRAGDACAGVAGRVTREKEREARRMDGSEGTPPSACAPRSTNATDFRRAASISSTTSPTALRTNHIIFTLAQWKWFSAQNGLQNSVVCCNR